jgi:ubiquinone/menaquinone biosynthesis C-methylase UbiE
MTELAERLKERFFRGEHPYRTFENVVRRNLHEDSTLLDAGCGRSAPVLVGFKGCARRLIGVDVVEFDSSVVGVELHRCNLQELPFEDGSIDVVMARSVMEHVIDPASVYSEIRRVLKPGGAFIFLTANLFDYASLIAKIIPNRFHPWIVAKTEGRDEQDVFPIAYRTNTRRAVDRLAQEAGFERESFIYLGQYPSYLMFNAFLFLLGTAYEKVISRFSSLHFLRGWILVTLRKPKSS